MWQAKLPGQRFVRFKVKIILYQQTDDYDSAWGSNLKFFWDMYPNFLNSKPSVDD